MKQIYPRKHTGWLAVKWFIRVWHCGVIEYGTVAPMERWNLLPWLQVASDGGGSRERQRKRGPTFERS